MRITNKPDDIQDIKHRQRIQPLLDLCGKIQIEYDWEQEEERELRAKGLKCPKTC
jgi:hypothetical protein